MPALAGVVGNNANQGKNLSLRSLLSDVAELVNSTASKKPVMHHAQAEQINNHHKCDEEHNLANPDPR